MTKVQLGLKNNWQQFSLLVLINAFVGGMVGLERSILPSIAEVEFSMAAKTIILSFIVVFGITKATANFFMGKSTLIFIGTTPNQLQVNESIDLEINQVIISIQASFC